jgi:hypothetical protein
VPIQVEWANPEQTILLYVYSDPIEVDAILQSDKQVDSMLGDRGITPAVIDARQVRKLPTNLLGSYPKLAREGGNLRSRVSPVYCVIDNYFVEQIATIYNRLYSRFQIVRTVEDALRLAEESLQNSESSG